MSPASVSLPPFPPEYRASGLLLHVTSLPSPYGIGDVGPAASAHGEDAGGRIANLNAMVLLADGLEHCLRSKNLGWDFIH